MIQSLINRWENVDLKLARNVSLSLDYSRLSFQFWADRPAILKSFVSLTSSFLVSPSANWHFFISTMERLGVSAIGCSHEIDRSAVVDASSRLHYSVGRVIRCRAEKKKFEIRA